MTPPCGSRHPPQPLPGPGEYIHQPVLLAEVLEALNPRPGGHYADGTIGGAGHAAAILEASSPTGWLWGCDRDADAVKAARARLAPYAGRCEIRQLNFADLDTWLEPGTCDGVLLDLGVSSPQLDRPERGFSFRHDGPLDMRMDTRQTLTAADLVNQAGADELANLFWELGGERHSRRFARAIVQDRQQTPFTTTRQLAALIERISPRKTGRTHPATKIFQALRLAVNDEINSLKRGLDTALRLLKPGGHLAVITFHSLEDRVVKHFGRARTQDYVSNGGVDIPELRQPRAPELRWLHRKAITPGHTELAANPRARSAQLRVLEKI
jgi:16S rRNA (cytosine1402-N4)-methyltransferase